MATSSGGPGKAGRAYLWIIAIVVLLAAGLSGAWYYLANQLDTRVARVIEDARARGTAIDCANQTVFGYPFRLGLRCDAAPPAACTNDTSNYMWLNGEPLGYQGWADGEPANPRGAAIEPDGWHGYDTLNNSFSYLCESPAP